MLGCSQEVRLHTTILRQRTDPELPQSDPVLIGPNLYQRTVGDLVSAFYELLANSTVSLPNCSAQCNPAWMATQNFAGHSWDLYDACAGFSTVNHRPRWTKTKSDDDRFFFSSALNADREDGVAASARLVAVCYCSESFSGSSEQECDGR